MLFSEVHARDEVPVGCAFWIGDREFTEADIELIRTTTQRFSRFSREEIVATLCENLPWKSPNGGSSDPHVENFYVNWKSSLSLLRRQFDEIRYGGVAREQLGVAVQTQLQASLQQILPVSVDLVSEDERADWNATMAAHHPLGFKRAFGSNLRYCVRVQGTPEPQIVGALLFGVAAKALDARDKWIGWDSAQRAQFRARIVNNNRYLILPGVRVAHLASQAMPWRWRRVVFARIDRRGTGMNPCFWKPS